MPSRKNFSKIFPQVGLYAALGLMVFLGTSRYLEDNYLALICVGLACATLASFAVPKSHRLDTSRG